MTVGGAPTPPGLHAGRDDLRAYLNGARDPEAIAARQATVLRAAGGRVSSGMPTPLEVGERVGRVRFFDSRADRRTAARRRAEARDAVCFELDFLSRVAARLRAWDERDLDIYLEAFARAEVRALAAMAEFDAALADARGPLPPALTEQHPRPSQP